MSNNQLWSAALVMVLWARVEAGEAPAAPCAPDDRSYLCGVTNAEDLVRLPGTRWIMASHMNLSFSEKGSLVWGFGPVQAFNIDTREVLKVFPASQAIVDWDQALFPDCSAPPDQISSHGINIRALGDRGSRLYVVNHGSRESVEVIDIALRDQRPVARWRGCMVVREKVSLNSVAVLPDNGIAVTAPMPGRVISWAPGRGWTKVEGIEGPVNGIEASMDGQWLYVNADRSVVRVPVTGGNAQKIFEAEFQLDNLRWGEDGRLYAAGFPKAFDWRECLGRPVCDGPFRIAQVDARALKGKEIYRHEGIKGAFGFSTVVLQTDGRLWVSSLISDRVLVLGPSDAPGVGQDRGKRAAD